MSWLIWVKDKKIDVYLPMFIILPADLLNFGYEDTPNEKDPYIALTEKLEEKFSDDSDGVCVVTNIDEFPKGKAIKNRPKVARELMDSTIMFVEDITKGPNLDGVRNKFVELFGKSLKNYPGIIVKPCLTRPERRAKKLGAQEE